MISDHVPEGCHHQKEYRDVIVHASQATSQMMTICSHLDASKTRWLTQSKNLSRAEVESGRAKNRVILCNS
jgi:hypothetical protein